MAKKSAADIRLAKQLAEMDPFHKEQFVAKRIYEQLICHLDRAARRRVLGIVNDYALQADRAKANAAGFRLPDE